MKRTAGKIRRQGESWGALPAQASPLGKPQLAQNEAAKAGGLCRLCQGRKLPGGCHQGNQVSPKLETPTSAGSAPKAPPGAILPLPATSLPSFLHRRSPGGERAHKLGALLTVCVKVLPDLQELGRRQLGQVQVRGLLLRPSHGEPLGDLRQHCALAARQLLSRTRPGLARHAAFIYNPEAAPAPRRQQGARALRESAWVSAGRRPTRGSAGVRGVGAPVCAETTPRLVRETGALGCKGERGCPCLPSPSL